MYLPFRLVTVSTLLIQSTGLPDFRNVDLSAVNRPLVLQYPIQRQGISALRSLGPHHFMPFGRRTTESKTIQAIWLLLCGHGDAAHEVLLGVNATNLDLAEYAATHPGQTTWQQDHPLDDVNDLLHSLIHRCEGSSFGEGGHSGFENAKYWAAGGPKEYFSMNATDDASHTSSVIKVIHQALLEWSFRNIPEIAALLVSTNSTRTYLIVASGGKRRQVKVHPGCWDPFMLIDLCCSSNQVQMNPFQKQQLDRLHEFELRLLLRYELLFEAYRTFDDDSLLIDQ